MPARTHRRLTVPSALLLAATIFLPAVKGCSDQPVHPYEVPLLCEPYLLGIMFAVIALVMTRRSVVIGTWILRVVLVAATAGIAALMTDAPAAALAFTIFGAVPLWYTLRWRGASETRFAIAAALLSFGSAIWFALWSSDNGALIGVKVSLVASIVLAIGCIRWAFEATNAPLPTPPPSPAPLPRAFAVS